MVLERRLVGPAGRFDLVGEGEERLNENSLYEQLNGWDFQSLRWERLVKKQAGVGWEENQEFACLCVSRLRSKCNHHVSNWIY